MWRKRMEEKQNMNPNIVVCVCKYKDRIKRLQLVDLKDTDHTFYT